ncbi:MAG: penicillin-binding transpeptidase domain-containing protein, partial [Gaiellaceae bacterium]
TPYDTLPCTGRIRIAKQWFKNWDPNVSQPMTLPTALAASCDTFFYQLGYDFYKLPAVRGQPLQAWARRFGFGQPTGIDVGPESEGLLPTLAWRRATFTRKTDPRNWQIDRLWKPGDSIQLAIGQKDFETTPLQLARFYAMIANGGLLVRPHVVDDVEQSGNERSPGQILHKFVPAPAQRVRLDPLALAAVRDGLYQATHATDGTSSGVFSTFPVPVAGKTGTAEKYVQIPGYSGLMDQSWWCGYAPAGPTDTPTIAVCALIENGGHGATAAAPAALKVFEQYFHQNGNPSQSHGD